MTAIGLGIGAVFVRVSGGAAPPPAPSYAISGATNGPAGVESSNITITGSNLTGPVTISYVSSDAGDTFNLASVIIDVGDEIKNIKITPDLTVGVRSITFSSAPAINDPAPYDYEATTPSVGGWTADSTTITADSTLVTADMT